MIGLLRGTTVCKQCYYCILYLDIPFRTHMTEDELQAARDKLDTEKKMRLMMREIAYHVIFLVCLLLVCNMNQDTNVYLQNQDLRNVFTKNISKVSIGRTDNYVFVTLYMYMSLEFIFVKKKIEKTQL